MSENGSSERVFQGRLITVRLESVHYPDGSASQYEIVDHPDAVAIVALRKSARRDSKGAEKGPAQHPEEAAARELAEEPGYRADHLRFLGRHYPAPGVLNCAILIYLATGLSPTSDHPVPDPHEIEQVVWRPLSQAPTGADAVSSKMTRH